MNLAYVRSQIGVALRVARFEPGAVHDFDHSVDGFFRSFFAIVLCAPFYLFAVLAQRRIAENAPTEMPSLDAGTPLAITPGYILFESFSYLANWLAFPIAMILIVRLIDATTRYAPFVVAYNWTACVVMFVSFVPQLLYLAGVIPITAVLGLYLPILIFAAVYEWRVAREALEISGWSAAGIVLIDYLLSSLVGMVIERLAIGGGAGG